MKDTICTVIGLIGGAIAALFGGWDTALQTLVIFMAIDYITGLVVAGVFHASPKTKTGALESKAGWRASSAKVRLCSLFWWPASLMLSSAAASSATRRSSAFRPTRPSPSSKMPA